MATMEFSVTELPHRCLRPCMFDVGETKDGATCMVYPDKFNIGVIVLRRGDDGGERWVLDRVVPLDTQLQGAAVAAVADGMKAWEVMRERAYAFDLVPASRGIQSPLPPASHPADTAMGEEEAPTATVSPLRHQRRLDSRARAASSIFNPLSTLPVTMGGLLLKMLPKMHYEALAKLKRSRKELKRTLHQNEEQAAML
ncbi:hypothetical protein EJB05_16311, partial [Eragrostis curvula]